MYFGDRKIENVEEHDNLVKVTLAFKEPKENQDGSKDVAETVIMPKWNLEAVQSEEPTDASEVRNREANYIVNTLIQKITELNVRTKDVSFYIQKLLTWFQSVEGEAIVRAFGHTKDEDIRVSDWLEKLK